MNEDIEETEHECTVCHEMKPASTFGWRTSRGKRYRRWQCGACRYKALPPNTARNQKRVHTARQLGLTLDAYLDLIGQDCHVCGKEAEDERQNGVYVNRHSGKITGVVCKACSQALGFAGHDPVRLKALVKLAAYSIE